MYTLGTRRPSRSVAPLVLRVRIAEARRPVTTSNQTWETEEWRWTSKASWKRPDGPSW